jgi:DNA-binding CsgD family transcriptional regulator
MALVTAASHEPLGSKTRSLRGAAKQANTRARDLELRIWKLLSEGKTPSAIARDVGIARQSVHRIIRRVEARYHEQIASSVGALKARQARALEAVLDEALDAWERSKGPARRVRKETGQPSGVRSRGLHAVSGGRTDLTRTEVQSRVGDPRFLTEAREALADLRKLYGLNATKSEVNSPELTPLAYAVEWGGE